MSSEINDNWDKDVDYLLTRFAICSIGCNHHPVRIQGSNTIIFVEQVRLSLVQTDPADTLAYDTDSSDGYPSTDSLFFFITLTIKMKSITL